MLLGIPRSARCVQRFDDSLNSAIHITYRISLRSSSMREPRDPLLKVVYLLFPLLNTFYNIVKMCEHRPRKYKVKLTLQQLLNLFEAIRNTPDLQYVHSWKNKENKCALVKDQQKCVQIYLNNDPSAGSPTETLLRLLLPLNDQV